MPDIPAINDFLQQHLSQPGASELTAVEAGRLLDQAGLLTDSRQRRGLPLRNLLRAGKITGADQRPPRPNGLWFITRSR